MKEKIKEAVYVALTGGVFYYSAKALKLDANAAVILGTAIGKILATQKINSNV